MEKRTFTQTIRFYLAEFAMIFLGILLAFWINDWGERKRDQEFVNILFENLVQDVKNDSIQVKSALDFVSKQQDSLQFLIYYLGNKNYDNANRLIHWTYTSYNVFNPTMETFESMIFGGDMKLLGDLRRIKSIKGLFHINDKLKIIHDEYFEGMEDFRNNFVCHYNMNPFDFESIPNKQEFWNRINFLKSDVMYYKEILLEAQKNYNAFLTESRQQK